MRASAYWIAIIGKYTEPAQNCQAGQEACEVTHMEHSDLRCHHCLFCVASGIAPDHDNDVQEQKSFSEQSSRALQDKEKELQKALKDAKVHNPLPACMCGC